MMCSIPNSSTVNTYRAVNLSSRMIQFGCFFLLASLFLAMMGCTSSGTRTPTLRDASVRGFYVFNRSVVLDDPKYQKFDYRVLLETNRMPKEQTIRSVAKEIRLSVDNPSDVDTLFFFLPGQRENLGAYAYVDFNHNHISHVTIIGERSLICSNWHPKIKANNNHCDFV